jgi:hypothetical protein
MQVRWPGSSDSVRSACEEPIDGKTMASGRTEAGIKSRAGNWARALALCLPLALLPTAAVALDRGADGNFSKRNSAHFELLQDVAIDRSGGFHGSRRFEQEVLADLERAYDRLEKFLGLRPKRRIRVVIYDQEVFDRQFAGVFRFAAAGFYHGVIRVRGATELTVELSRVLHHELVHAGLDTAAPSYRPPAWLNEGLAEWFEARALGKRRLNQAETNFLSNAHDEGALFSLASLSTPSFGHLGPNAAQLAYLQAYGMVDFLSRIGGEDSLREICDGLVRTHDIDRTIRRVFKADLGRLQERFFDELG